MSVFSFSEMDIPGAFEVQLFFAEDNRGYFVKNFERDIFKECGITMDISEVFVSSSKKNVIRGMHFQLNHPQTKLVSVLQGEIYDVIVDLREDSPTFGQWRGVYLSAQNKKSLFVPRGCAHGFLSLCDATLVNYICDGKYDKDTDTGILYCDPDIAVDWPIHDIKDAIVGKRDQEQMTFKTFKEECKFCY